MNLPKETRSYCPKCKSHQKMKVSIYKAGKRRGSAAGERRHALRKKGIWWTKIPKTCKTC